MSEDKTRIVMTSQGEIEKERAAHPWQHRVSRAINFEYSLYPSMFLIAVGTLFWSLPSFYTGMILLGGTMTFFAQVFQLLYKLHWKTRFKTAGDIKDQQSRMVTMGLSVMLISALGKIISVVGLFCFAVSI